MATQSKNKKTQAAGPSIQDEYNQRPGEPVDTPDSSNQQPSKTFNLLVDEIPYMVKVTPFSFNGEARFYVKINEGLEHVFTWDSELGRLRPIDDSSALIPDSLEQAISVKLESMPR